MKNISTFLLSFFFLSITTNTVAQFPIKSKESNAEKRNQDFLNRRISNEPVDFAKSLYRAYDALSRTKSHAKANQEWVPIGPFGKEKLAGMGRVNSMQFHPTDTNIWYICVAQGGVWKTTNAGQSWTSISGDLPVLRTSYLSVHSTNPDTMYVALGDYAYLGHNLQANENKRSSHYGLGVYKTVNGGVSWSATGLSFAQTDFEASLIAKVFINESNPESVLAVGQTGSFYSEDGGDTWIKSHDGLFWDLEKDPTNDSVLYASTGYVHAYKIGKVSILKTTDFGKTWTASKTPIPDYGKVQRVELAVSPSDPSYVYAIACDTQSGFYGFYRSTDYGLNFSERIQADDYPYNILNHNMSDQDGGQGRYDLAICVDKTDKDNVLIGGINIWQTLDGGKNFKPITYWLLNYYGISLHADVHEIVQHPSNHSIFACHDGGISRSFDIIQDDIETMTVDYSASTEWVNYTDGLNITSFYRLGINQQNGEEVLAGAQDNSTVYGSDGKFANISGGDGMECVFNDEAFYRYTSSQNGNIYAYLSDFGGFEYEDRVSPPNGERGEWTTPFIAANKKLYVLYGNLYTLQGSFVDERKSTFSDVFGTRYPKLGTALDVEKTNGNHIYLAKRGYASAGVTNAIKASNNNGQTWSDIGDGLPDFLYPSYIEINQSRPKEVWITFSGFDSTRKVFHSTNSGAKWENITYNLPNIPVNCITHQEDGSNDLYIGTDLGVFVLKGDTTVWVHYSEGLPNVIVNELEIDTTNKTLVAATFGRGLWEVGIDFENNGNVSVKDFSKSETTIELFPNPTTTEITIGLSNVELGSYNLLIKDITGKTVIARQVTNESNGWKLSVNVEELVNGNYFLVVTDIHKQRYTSRFTKK